MTEEKDKKNSNSDKNGAPSSSGNIAERCHKRIQEEDEKYFNSDKEKTEEIDSDFIHECLYENEHGDGALYARLFAGKFLYAKKLKEWLVFKGHHLEVDFMEDALTAVEEVTKIYKKETLNLWNKIQELKKEEGNDEEILKLNETRKALNKRVNRLYTDRGRINCLKHAHTIKSRLAILGDQIDQQPYLLAVQNGIIDLKTGELRNGKIEDYLMKASPVEWKDINEPCPEWERALSQIFEDYRGKPREKVVKFIQRLIGYVLIGSVEEHVFVMMAGSGRNGKGTIMRMVEYILGSLAGTVQSEMLLGQKAERSSAAVSPDIMNLRGLRLANASETDDGRRFSSSKVKWLSGGDRLQGRFPYDKRMTDFDPTHTLFLQTNHPPHAQSSDKPFWERLILIELFWEYVRNPKNPKKERQRDTKLEKRLQAEASGILAWMVRGCRDYQIEGLNIPDEVIAAGKKYKKSEDDMAEWYDNKCDLGEDYEGGSKEMYDNFKDWFKDNVSDYKISHRKFSLELVKALPDLVKYKNSEGITFYRGIRLKP